MADNQLLQLAQAHLNSDLEIAESYLRATHDAHNLASQFERLILRNPVGTEERSILRDIYNALNEIRVDTLRLFDTAAGRIDRNPRGYAVGIIYPTFNGYLMDARKRLEALKQGRIPITGPTIDAATAGFHVPDDYPGVTPLAE